MPRASTKLVGTTCRVMFAGVWFSRIGQHCVTLAIQPILTSVTLVRHASRNLEGFSCRANGACAATIAARSFCVGRASLAACCLPSTVKSHSRFTLPQGLNACALGACLAHMVNALMRGIRWYRGAYFLTIRCHRAYADSRRSGTRVGSVLAATGCRGNAATRFTRQAIDP